MDKVDKAMDSVEQHDLYGQREVPIAHARVLAAEVRRLRAMLEPTQDARELVGAISGVDPDHYIGGSTMHKRAAETMEENLELVAAYRARLLDEAAERGMRYYENTAISERSGEGLYKAISGHERSAIKGGRA